MKSGLDDRYFPTGWIREEETYFRGAKKCLAILKILLSTVISKIRSSLGRFSPDPGVHSASNINFAYGFFARADRDLKGRQRIVIESSLFQIALLSKLSHCFDTATNRWQAMKH